DSLKDISFAESGKFIRAQEEILKPARRLDQELHKLTLPQAAHLMVDLFVERLLGGRRIPRVAATLSDASIGNRIENPIFPDAPIEVRPFMVTVNPELSGVGRDRAGRKSMIVDIQDQSRTRPGLKGVGR